MQTQKTLAEPKEERLDLVIDSADKVNKLELGDLANSSTTELTSIVVSYLMLKNENACIQNMRC